MLIKESIDWYLPYHVNEGKKDPKAKVRNRGDVIFPAESKAVKDDADHFPINNIGQARNALSRAGQTDGKAPSWYDGDYASFRRKVRSAVHKKYPSIDINESLNETDVYEHVAEFQEDLKRIFPDLQSFNYKEEDNYIELPLDEYSEYGMNALDDAVRELVNDKYAASGWVVIDDDSMEQMFGDEWPEESPFYDEENIYIKLPEYLVEMEGGKAEKDGVGPDDVDPDQLEVGVETEMEHTDDDKIALEIALDHLAEDPEYYTTLVQAGLVDEPEALKKYRELIAGDWR